MKQLIVLSDDVPPHEDKFAMMVIHHRFDEPNSTKPLCRIDVIDGYMIRGDPESREDFSQFECNPNYFSRADNLFIRDSGLPTASRLRTNGALFPDVTIAFAQMAMHPEAEKAGFSHGSFHNGLMDWFAVIQADGTQRHPFVLTRVVADRHKDFTKLVKSFVKAVEANQPANAYWIEKFPAGTPFRSFMVRTYNGNAPSSI